MTETIWTRARAITAVQDFAARKGYQPVSRESGPHNALPSYSTAAQLFGNWTALIEAAGFRPYPARSSAQAKTMAHQDRNPVAS